MPSVTPLIVFHGECPDGTTAAWAAWTALKGKCTCVPAYHGREASLDAVPRPLSPGSQFFTHLARPVFFLDFCPSRRDLEDFKRAAANNGSSCPYPVMVIDHHESAKKDLYVGERHHQCAYSDFRFETDKSGARLAWEYFHPSEPIPTVVAYTEDRDLWKHKLTGTKEINAWISSFPLNDPKTWDSDVACIIDRGAVFTEAYKAGEVILRFQERSIERALASARSYNVPMPEGGIQCVPGVNCTDRTILSEVAGRLASQHHFAFCWYMDVEGQIVVSLRSRKGTTNVAEIASYLGRLPYGNGGGGHPAAAGCQFRKMPEFILSGYNLV